jgi:RNA polymerase sigma factor (sigma-70 family)
MNEGNPEMTLASAIAGVLPLTRSGDPTARGRLIEICDPILLSRVRRHLSPERFRTEGEDVLQGLRLALLKALPSVRSDDAGSFLSWLEKLVRCRLRDWDRARASARRPEMSLQDTDCPEVAAPISTPSRIVMSEEEAERVLLAIEKVPELYREVLRVIVREDPGPEAIAASLGKSPEAARKFVARALRHLKRTLGKRGISGFGRPD